MMAYDWLVTYLRGKNLPLCMFLTVDLNQWVIHTFNRCFWFRPMKAYGSFFWSLRKESQPNQTSKFGAWHLNRPAKLDNFLLQKLCAIIILWHPKNLIIGTDLLFLPSPAFNHLATIAIYQERYWSHLFKRPVWLVQNSTQFPNQLNMMQTAAPATWVIVANISRCTATK